MEEATENQQDISKVPQQLQPHVFKKGQSGNPAGRPPTSTLKEFARRYLAGLTDDERIEYFEGIPKTTIWEMAEGKPKQDNDITSGGRPIQVVIPEQLAKAFNIDATNTETSGGNTEQETV